MSPETLFHEALAKPPAERTAFLEQACAGQPDLRARVEALLAAHGGVDSLLDRLARAGEATAEHAPPVLEEPPVTAEHEPTDGPGAVIAGKYTLEQKLGEGGMGEVWVAKQSAPVKRRVALKLIKAGMDSKAVLQRFDQERQALAVMDHPHIAKVFDGGLTAARRPFFAMELVNGLPLTKFCDEAKLSIPQRLELFVPICQAVQHAHQKGIVHRDLKPSNILVTLIDGQPVPKVIDFGVAKAIGGKLTEKSLSTHFGAVVGTLEYMSPEQAGFTGTDVDTRADIYSLGVILYELLTGLRPFDGKRLREAALDEMIRILREEEPSKPSTRLSTDAALPSLAAVRRMEPQKLTGLLRGELDWVVMKCLEKDRNRRYESASGLAQDIQRHLADEPVQARPPSFRYRAGKVMRRYRGPMLAAALVLLVLVGGIIGTTWGLIQADRERRHAEESANQALWGMYWAEAEGEVAREAEAHTAAVSQFLCERVLAAARPEGWQHGLGVNVTVAQALIAAEKHLEEDFAGLPQAEALARHAIAVTWRNRDPADYPKAERHLRRAIALRTDTIGPKHRNTIDSKNSLGVLLGMMGHRQESIRLLEEVLAWKNKTLGEKHPSTLATLSTLAANYLAVGQRDQALRLCQQVHQQRHATLGPRHPDTLKSVHSLAHAHRARGRLDLALPLQEETYALMKTVLGVDHPDTIICMGELAICYQELGRHDLALPLYTQGLQLKKAKFGPQHFDTIIAMNNLATGYMAAGKPEQAIPLFEETRRLWQTTLGADHAYTMACTSNLAMSYRAVRKLDRSVPLLEETLQRFTAKLGPDHAETLTCRNNLAMCYQEAGQPERALHHFEETLRLRQAKLGPDHPDTLTSLTSVGVAYYVAGKHDQALLLFQQAAEGMERRHFKHQNAPTVVGNLIQLLERQKKDDQAEPWRRKWLAYIKDRDGADAVTCIPEMIGLALNLQEQKKWREAETVLRECLTLRTRREPNAWSTFNMQSMLGGALLHQKKYTQAESLLLAGYQGMKQQEAKIPPQGKPRLIESLERLVQLYEATGKKDEAAKWRQELEAAKAAHSKMEAKP